MVILNSLVFIFFTLSFGKPQTPRDWCSLGSFSGFIIALFARLATSGAYVYV
jgi:hypothetical protein